MAVIECQHCSVSVEVGGDSGVRSGHTLTSGGARVWVIYDGGTAVHRCVEGTDAGNRAA